MDQENNDAILTLPDGKTYKFPIIKGTAGPPVIDIKNFYSQTGCFTFDPGFTSTASCVSGITYADGEQGLLWYRGYDVQELADKCCYLEVCYLLLYGSLPNSQELHFFEQQIQEEMPIHQKLIDFYSSFQQGAHPMAIMVGVIGAYSAFVQNSIDVNSPSQREAAAIKIIAKFPMMAAVAYRTAYGLPIVYPQKKYSYVENFLYMMFSDPMSNDFQINPIIIETIEKLFILHADHEQNASTSTVRIAGSSLANPFACIASGIASLWGLRHGGGMEAAMQMLDTVKNNQSIGDLISRAKDKNNPFVLMGFGHRIYKNFDPRSQKLKEIAHKLFSTNGSMNQDHFHISLEIEEMALKDEYFIEKKLYPNVDFYSGVILEAIGIPRTMFIVIFALSRAVGWISQWNEMMSETVRKIGRPRQLYVGKNKRVVIPIEERECLERINPSHLNSKKFVWSQNN